MDINWPFVAAQWGGYALIYLFVVWLVGKKRGR